MLNLLRRTTPEALQVSGPGSVDGRAYQQWLARGICVLEETPTELRVGVEAFTRSWMLTHYPVGEAHLGRLKSLLTFHLQDHAADQVQVRLTHWIRPDKLPDGMLMEWRRRRQAQQAAESKARGMADAETTQALDSYTLMHNAKAFKEDIIARYWVAITLVAPDKETLDRLAPILEGHLVDLSLAATPLYQEQMDGLLLGSVVAQPPLNLMAAWPGHLTHGGALSYLYPALHGSISDGRGIYLGHEVNACGYQSAIYVDMARERALNILVSGLTGEGKSTLVKTVIPDCLLENFIIAVFDNNGEYGPLCQALGGTEVMAAPGSGCYFEPFRLLPPIGDAEYDGGRLRRAIKSFKAMIRTLVTVDDDDMALVDALVLATLQAAGVDPDRPETWEACTVSVHDWWTRLKTSKGEATKHLIGRLRPYFEGAERLFVTPIEPNWRGARLIRIHMGDKLSSEDNEKRVASALAKLAFGRVWDWILVNRRKAANYALLIFEEGQRAARDADFTHLMYLAATDGRRQNAGVMFCANDVNVFFETDAGKGLWENATMRVLFYLQDSGLRLAAQNADIPPEVMEEIGGLAGSYQYVVNRGRTWAKARMILPDSELGLVATRGLRKEG